MMKKDISANLYLECLILCSLILLNVLHNKSLTVLLPWQYTGFQTSPIFKAFLGTFQAENHQLKILRSIGWAWKRVSCVFSKTISLPSFNGLWCRLGGSVAKWLGHRTLNPEVAGLSPALTT